MTGRRHTRRGYYAYAVRIAPLLCSRPGQPLKRAALTREAIARQSAVMQVNLIKRRAILV